MTQLSVYRFDQGLAFDGGLVGAVERLELGGDTRLLDALFVARDPEGGEVAAIDLASAGAGGSFASLLDFRLDAGRRRAITERTLAEHRGGVPGSLIESIAVTLEPGAALVAILHSGAAPTVFHDAVARAGGRQIVDDAVDARALADLGPHLVAAGPTDQGISSGG
jgi:hypothetical protein